MTDLDDDYTTELADNSDKGSDLSTDEDVIELTDIVKDETTNPDLEVEKEDEFDFELSDSKDAEQIDDEFTDVELEDVELEDVELEDDAADFTVDKPETEPGLERAAPDDFNIDQEQIETILERIIEKKFAGKIDSILFEVMENVIEKQIVEIKERLQKEL